MASYENGTADLSPYQRGAWFSSGWGRASIGYTEDMSAMSESTRQGIGFKVMPLSDTTSNPPVFFADVIGINTTTSQRGTRSLAVQLANVMAAATTVVESIGPDATDPYPQYLMSTRPSVFKTLATPFPIYAQMYALVSTSNPIMFKVDATVRSWLKAMKGTVQSDSRANYTCGCDFTATQYIADNSAAPAICQPTCSSHGGWNGQWTNQYPAAPSGKSVCGCKACPTS